VVDSDELQSSSSTAAAPVISSHNASRAIRIASSLSYSPESPFPQPLA
jgi:hypothetical protein